MLITRNVEQIDTLYKKIAENAKEMEDMKWFFNKNSNMFGENTMKRSATLGGDNFEDLENAAAGMGEGPHTQLLTRILTYIRKLEIKVEDKSEKQQC